MHKILVKGGRVIDPETNLDKVMDVLIEDNIIASIENSIKADKGVIIDAKGMLVVPGLIDAHVHLREPGYEYKETIQTGLRAAAKGGFASVCCMPNTNPVCDNGSVVRYIIDKAEKANLCRVYPIGAVTKGLEGKELSEIGKMKEAGAVALSDDGKSVSNPYILRRAMEYASTFSMIITDHCEEESLSESGTMHEGYFSTKLGLQGIPSASEEIIVARDILISRETGIPVHIAHVSSKGTVAIIRWAKEQGIPITAETTVHHLLLTDANLQDYNTNFKVNPPFRTEDDRQAIIDGLKDGTIDIIVTDHAPHADIDKDLEFDYAAFGIIGLETCLPLLLSSLEITQKIPLPKLIAKLTINPARIFNLPGGKIRKGEPADITIVDPEKKITITESYFSSKSTNSPFIGWDLQGFPEWVIVDGRIILDKGVVVGS